MKHGSILVSVTKELEEFDKKIFLLLKKITLKFDELYMVSKPKIELGLQNVDLTAFQPLLDDPNILNCWETVITHMQC